MIEALEKLRELRNAVKAVTADNPYWVCGMAEKIADEIQAEIDSRYMELPVDADGVPIHVGDKVVFIGKDNLGAFEVAGISSDSFFCYHAALECCSHWANTCRHVKPDPVKELLCEFASDVSCMGDGVKRSFSPDEKCIVELADAIREAVSAE